MMRDISSPYMTPRVGVALNERNAVDDGKLYETLQSTDVLELLLHPDCTVPSVYSSFLQQWKGPLRLHISPRIKGFDQFNDVQDELHTTMRYLTGAQGHSLDALVTHPFSRDAPLDEFTAYIAALRKAGALIEIENGTPYDSKNDVSGHLYEAFSQMSELAAYLSSSDLHGDVKVVLDVGKWAEENLIHSPDMEAFPLYETIQRYDVLIRSLHLCEKRYTHQPGPLKTISINEGGCIGTGDGIHRLVSTPVRNYIIETNEMPGNLLEDIKAVRCGLYSMGGVALSKELR